MGSGISSLSVEQQVVYTQSLRAKIGALDLEGISEDEMRRRVLSESEELINRLLSGSLETKSVSSKKREMSIKIPFEGDGIDEHKTDPQNVGELSLPPVVEKPPSPASDNKSNTGITPRYAQSTTSSTLPLGGTRSLPERPLSRAGTNRPGSRASSRPGTPKDINPSAGNFRGSAAASIPPRSVATADRGMRRKSFDIGMKRLETAELPPKAMAQSKTLECLPTASNMAGFGEFPISPMVSVGVADCWDSVSMQPFCNMCQMAFKTDYLLERHKSYSQLHITKLKKHEEIQKDIEQLAAESAAIEERKEETEAVTYLNANQEIIRTSVESEGPTNLIEGLHYTLLYIGTKFYWRSQKSVDLRFYHHLQSHVIEIISFDPMKGKEYNRILLNCDVINQLIEPKIQIEVDKVKETMRADRFAGKIDEAVVREEFHRTVLTTYILQRLQLISEVSSSRIDANMNGITFVKLTGDLEVNSWYPLFDKPPRGFTPIIITQRRYSSIEEIKGTIKDVVDDYASALELNSQAEMYSELAGRKIEEKKFYGGSNMVGIVAEDLPPHYMLPTNAKILKIKDVSKEEGLRRKSFF